MNNDGKMFCPQCQKEGLKSCVYEEGGTSTLVGFIAYYDEDGNYHKNDPNIHTLYYSCTQGHKWCIKKRNGEII